LRMSSLENQIQIVIIPFSPGKRHSPVHEFPNTGWTFPHDHLDNVVFAQSVTGGSSSTELGR
jgi:hypothetical protein